MCSDKSDTEEEEDNHMVSDRGKRTKRRGVTKVMGSKEKPVKPAKRRKVKQPSADQLRRDKTAARANKTFDAAKPWKILDVEWDSDDPLDPTPEYEEERQQAEWDSMEEYERAREVKKFQNAGVLRQLGLLQ
jgi:hypothetical protein